jgi:hypothetical protein
VISNDKFCGSKFTICDLREIILNSKRANMPESTLPIVSVSEEIIVEKIFIIRGQKVMLDSDLAEMYRVEVRVLNQAVKCRRVQKLEITICDFKLGWGKVASIRLH